METIRGSPDGKGIFGQNDNGEFVASDAGDEVVSVRKLTKAVGNRDQKFVAVTMAVGVIDLLEAIQINQQEPYRALPTTHFGQGFFEMF